jgi:NADPH:quinone reductase-like Zn-dependent oxidoreductase
MKEHPMKAIIWTKYGSPDGLQLQEVEKPVPKADEILVKVHATSVTAGDCEMRRLQLPLGLSFPIRVYAGFTRPKRIAVLGQELAGEVVETGDQVSAYQKGDQVFGTTGFGFGAYAEYICLPALPDDAQGVLAAKPTNISYEEAATVPTAGFEALHFLREANIQPGNKVLMIGGGGSSGSFAIQLAKHFRAEVTGVDSSSKQEMMRSLGAEHVIDYTKDDYTKTDEKYDLIIDVVGKHSIGQRVKLLKPDGVYYLAFARISDIALGWWISATSKKKLKIQSANQKKEDLDYLAGLLAEGKLRSVIDRIYPLEQVAEAHRYVEAGGKKGNIAISVVDQATKPGNGATT